MKILYIITQADGGGAQTYTLAVAKHFQGAIAAGDEAQKLFNDARTAGLSTYKLKHLKRNINLWHDLLAPFEIYRLVKKLKPDIVHANSTKAGLHASIGGKLAGARVIFTAHGFRFLEPLSPVSRRFYFWMEKFASHFRDFIITVSNVDKDAAIKAKLIDSKKIATIHNGLPQIDFATREDARSLLHLSDSSHSNEFRGLESLFTFVTIANLYPTKGLDALIEAVGQLDAVVRDQSRFVIIGSGPEEQNLKFKIQNLKLENYILLLGNVPNAKTCLKAFDAFILPSRKEGFPYALLEAMQAGLPIIATDVGGNREAIGDAGIIVKTEDPQALSDAIKKVAEDKNLRQRLGQKSTARSQQFTEDKMLAETEKIYRKLV